MLTGVALGKNEATSFSVKHTGKTPGSSTGVKFKISFGNAEVPNGVPQGLQSFKIKLHKGTKLDGRGAAQCRATAADLMSKGAGACPAASRIGSGNATATSAVGASVKAEAAIFNEKFEGRDAFLFIFLIDDAYITAFDGYIKGNTLSSTGLTGALPGDFVVTKFNGTINKHSKGKGKRRHDLITAPKVCPKRSRKWTNTATFVFQNGDKDNASNTSPCKPGG
jgi:hypothetical protein